MIFCSLLLLAIAGSISAEAVLTAHDIDAMFVGPAVPPSLDEKSYSVFMDAGSSGTRVYVYSWTRTSASQLINLQPVTANNVPVVKKITPGLSTFGNNSVAASAYIKPLLELAEKNIPAAKQPSTPVFIFATAGMRLLPEEQQEAVLTNLRTSLPTMTTLNVSSANIKIIDGQWEGIYNWISVNYIMGHFDRHNATRASTVGMTEMGGASVQIAYELPPNNTFSSDDVVTINLGYNSSDKYYSYKLFATTFLGYGANEGYKRYEEYVSDKLKNNRFKIIKDNCLPKNFRELVERDNRHAYLRSGTGDWNGCLSDAEALLKKSVNQKTCKIFHPICYLGYVPAPNVSLSHMEMFGFAEYYYSTHVVLGLGGAYDANTIAEKSKKFCGTDWSDMKASSQTNLWPGVDEDRLENQCFKAAWVTSILHDGFAIDKKDNDFQTALTVDGQEVQWTLGAMVYEMRNS